jgi:hypothetical protein
MVNGMTDFMRILAVAVAVCCKMSLTEDPKAYDNIYSPSRTDP